MNLTETTGVFAFNKICLVANFVVLIYNIIHACVAHTCSTSAYNLRVKFFCLLIHARKRSINVLVHDVTMTQSAVELLIINITLNASSTVIFY